jgi:hypothetical protein
MDWKYALSLELTDPGFDFTLLHDCRQRLLAHEAGQRSLDSFLATCKTRGWSKARGTQRTDATHVLAAIRTLHRFECVLEAMRHALNQLSETAPTWVQQQVPREWYARDGLRAGVESRLSPGTRRFDRRRSCYIGLARTHLQQFLTATARNLGRVIAWLWGEPLGERRRPPGPFAQLSPHLLSRQTVLC